MVETAGIACPACGALDESGVKDTRPQPGGWRRRRVCEPCGYRFTTIEAVVESMPVVFERVVSGTGRSVIRPRTMSPVEIDPRILAARITEAVQRVLAS